MPYDHTDDLLIRYPAPYPRVHSHLREKDLVFGPEWRDMGQEREVFFVRSPSHLCRRGALLPQPLDRPGADEFVYLFGAVGDLRIAFAAVYDLYAQFSRKVRKIPIVNVFFYRFYALFGIRSIPYEFFGYIDQPFFSEVRDQAGIRAMVNDGGRRMRPTRSKRAQFHLPEVEGFFERRFTLYVGIRIPFLDGSVYVEHLIVMAPV